ncbi:hypothetical protein FQN60_004843 [Etheostoma spectabile]|uniref:Microtubule-associated tumor suppressor candidate 2 n=1 Tax=Etheostoma spectabile TaxID=54343 RepID=A0A5J5DLB8_9PERO|nr:hypothetical protein FQN60_004843 [Etheostoma spectabile]
MQKGGLPPRQGWDGEKLQSSTTLKGRGERGAFFMGIARNTSKACYPKGRRCTAHPDSEASLGLGAAPGSLQPDKIPRQAKVTRPPGRGQAAPGYQDPRRAKESEKKGPNPPQGRPGENPPSVSVPPGFPLPSSTTFGFARSSSVSSVSSTQSNDSSHSDPCRASQHPGSGSDDTHLHNATAPPSEASNAQSRPHPPNAPSLQRRSLPPQRCSPLASRRERQKDIEAVLPPKSSPKRFAVVSPKPQSPAAGPGVVGTERAQELDRALIQQLRERCEQQDLQLQSLQAQLKKASLCLDVFSITTQHFCHKTESAVVKERELSLELARIRDEVAFSVAHWEQLQQEKEELERRFKAELQGLRAQQQRELGVLEERLKVQHGAQVESLQAQQRAELEELRVKQQEQMAHEQQTKSLEEEFEKIRLSLQDALAPYKHIDEDLKSLKEVLEMKNQQIHQQELKISELEKIAEKNVYLEERLQVLQQQNEDLKERIDKNLAVSRQLSEDNANLQVNVVKESNEKKRLSRTNEELLWRLQTGELSPRMSPSSSPIHRPSSGPGSPARPHSYHQ